MVPLHTQTHTYTDTTHWRLTRRSLSLELAWYALHDTYTIPLIAPIA